MKSLISLVLILMLPILLIAQVNSNHVYVNGYYRSDGTYVRGHYRTAPNSTNRDNFSTIGNVNPYTGKAGWITPDNHTYVYRYEYNPPLSNSYYSLPTSFFNSSSAYSTSVSSNSTSVSYKTEWSGTSNGYFFYFKGKHVSTTNEWDGDDLIVFYDKHAFRIRDYNNKTDGIRREPEPLATWSSTGNSYYFYYDGVNISGYTTNDWFGNDLMVYYGNHAYLLEDYSSKKDGKFRIARNIPTWSYNGKSYYFYVNGESVANKTENSKFGNDLLVEYEDKVYLLPDLFNKKDGSIQTALELPQWKSIGNSYSLYLGNTNISNKTKYEWYGDNLIVYFENCGYILIDYKTQKDGKLRVAYPIPTFKTSGSSSFYFYINGRAVIIDSNKWNGDDLIVTYKEKEYVLKNYKNSKDGVLRFALYK